MSRSKLFGLGLCTISLVLALGTGLFMIIGGRIPLVIFTWPALGLIVGVAIFFFSFIETGLGIDDEIEDFPQLIEDDLKSLRSRVFTPAFLYVILTLMALITQLGVLVWYRKDLSSWGPINVMLVALVVVVLALVWSLRSNWFQWRKRRLGQRVFLIPAAGWLICMIIGVSFAEPKEFGGRSQLDRAQATSAVPTRAGTYFLFDTAEMAGDVLISSDCDGEACLVMILIGVVLMAVLASATIPHFWVVATILLLTFMGVITLRELLYREGYG